MKNFYLTIDLEEWYHLLYLKNETDFKGEDFFIFKLEEILSILEKHNIRATFFVLAELAEKHPHIIREIHSKGHEISCHGLNHDLITNKTLDQFTRELKKAKSLIEDIIKSPISGYRAPCFSLTDQTLAKLLDIGFKYDSSFIKFSNHKLYGKLKMSDYRRISNLRLINSKKFIEFQIPTTKIGKFEIPFSGGGYLRIIPWFLFKIIFKRELDKNTEYQIFLHPFELYSGKFKLPFRKDLHSLFRFYFNRRRNIYKVDKLIKIALSKGYNFKVMKEVI